jgi:DNA modification methylase
VLNVTARVLVGDNRKRLAELDAGSVQCVVTSPPYWGLRDYGQEDQIGLESTPEEFVEELCLVFDEVWRVLADDGTLWLNLGDTYCTIPHGSKGVNAPQSFEHKGSQNRGQDRNGAATSGGGHANRKPLPGLKHKDLVGIPWRVAFALQERGWYLRQDIIWAKPNPMPESVTDRCTKSHEYIFLLTKKPQYYFDNVSIKEPVSEVSLKRAEYAFHSDRPSTKNASMGGAGIHTEKMGSRFVNPEGRNKRDVWNVATKPYAEAHFATYPPELILPCILAGSKEGDLILDPFSGSGTTGQVAMQLGRNYVGCELNPEYASLSEKRLTDAIGMFGSVEIV